MLCVPVKYNGSDFIKMNPFCNQSIMFISFVIMLFYFIENGNSIETHNIANKFFIRYPPIGRLFKADLPLEETPATPLSSKLTDVNGKTITRLELMKFHKNDDSNNISRSSISNRAIYQSIKDSTDKLKRFKIMNESLENITQDKTKHKLDTKIHGETKHKIIKRLKRNAQNLVNKTSQLELSKSNITEVFERNSSDKEANRTEWMPASKKAFVHKLLQRKVESLFNVDLSKNSGMKEEEIEKSKLLRKQLLNYYIKSKQQKSSLPNQTENKSDSTVADVSSSRHVRMSIDIPVDDVESIEDLFEEIEVEKETTEITKDTEGRGRRRRLRKIAIPLLLLLKLKILIFAPIIFGFVSLIAFKGLWAGMTALGVVSALVFKSLFNNQVKVMYELRPPHHHHYPPMGISEIQYHGYPEYWNRREDSYRPVGGWSSDYQWTTPDERAYKTTNIEYDLKTEKQLKPITSPALTDCAKQSTQA